MPPPARLPAHIVNLSRVRRISDLDGEPEDCITFLVPVQVLLCDNGGVEYYTPEHAAEAMGITVRALRKRIQRGDVRAVRLSERVLLIPEIEVERLRGQGKFKPGRKPGKETTE